MLQSIPIFTLAAMQPPKKVIAIIEQIMANFLWGSAEGSNKYHWIAWKYLCRPIEEGGLGFKDLNYLVEAFSIKLWWNFKNQNFLWAQFMKKKYCRIHHPRVAKVSRGSHVWKRM